MEQEYFPILKKGDVTEITAEEKAEPLYQECFPAPPEVDLSDLVGTRYQRQLYGEPEADLEVTDDEQQAAIARPKPDKTLGDSGLTNRVVTIVAATSPKRL